MSDDDIAQLKRMRDHGEITQAQYDVLRRHVLWGTPLPEAVEALAEQEGPAPPYAPAAGNPPAPPYPPAAGNPPAAPYPGPPSGGHPAAPPYPDPATGHRPAVPPYRYPATGAQPAVPYPGPPTDAHPAQPYPGPLTGAQPAVPYPGTPTGSRPAAAPPYQPPWPTPPAIPVPEIPPASSPRWGSESWWHPDRPPPPPETAHRHRAPEPPPAPHRPAVPEAPSEPRRRGGRAAFLLSLLLVVALVGAGVWWFVLRKPGVAPAEYARAVCSQVAGWHADVTARSGQLQQALNSNNDPEATRSALATFFDQMASRTDQLRTDIDDLGTPAIAGGQSYVDGLDRKLDDTTASFRDSAQKSRDLNVNDKATFTITVQVLQSQVDQLIGGVTGSLASTSTPGELRTAYNNASGCAPFTG